MFLFLLVIILAERFTTITLHRKEFRLLNPIVYKRLFDQRNLHGRRQKCSHYLTSKPKVMGTPNLSSGLVFTEFKEWFWVDNDDHGDVKAIFLKFYA